MVEEKRFGMSVSAEEVKAWAEKQEGFRNVMSNQGMFDEAYTRYEELCQQEGLSDEMIHRLTKERFVEVTLNGMMQELAQEAAKALFASKSEQDMLKQTIENTHWVEEQVEESIQSTVLTAKRARTIEENPIMSFLFELFCD